jgi:hypothetical protein
MINPGSRLDLAVVNYKIKINWNISVKTYKYSRLLKKSRLSDCPQMLSRQATPGVVVP